MKKSLSLVLILLIVFVSFETYLAQEAKGVEPAAALTKLKEGNARFVKAQMTHPDQTAAVRTEVAKGQKPFAIIVSCSDSRVPPEVIFDQGLGDLFVVRVAGNLVDDNALGSIEYAVEHLGVKLVVVLGHERCGAVDATVKGGEAPGHIASLVKAIEPSVEKAKKAKGDVLENAIKFNALAVTEKIITSKPILMDLVKQRRLKVVTGRYDLDDGKFTLY